MASQQPQNRSPRQTPAPGGTAPNQTAPVRRESAEPDLISRDEESDVIGRRDEPPETDRIRFDSRSGLARRSQGDGAYDDESEVY